MGANVTHSSTFFKSRVVSQVVKTYLWDSPFFVNDDSITPAWPSRLVFLRNTPYLDQDR